MNEQRAFIQPIELQKKKSSIWKKLMVLIPVVILVGVIVAMYNPLEEKRPDNEITIGNYIFYEMPEEIFATAIIIGGKQIPVFFRLDPREAGDIAMDEQALQQILNSKKIYLAFSPNHKDVPRMIVSAGEISRILGVYGIESITSYTEDSNPINPDVPIKTCADVSEEIGVIIVGTAAETGITVEQGCVIVNGKTAEETILAADKLGMNLIGIRL